MSKRILTVIRNLSPRTKFEKEHPIEVRGILSGAQRLSLSDKQAAILCANITRVNHCWDQKSEEEWPD
jgi:hypothetical protein